MRRGPGVASRIEATMLALRMSRALIASALLLGLAHHVGAAPLTTGEAMPSLRGHTLGGNDAELPAIARGRVTLVAMGFTYRSRDAVEPWVKRFREGFPGDSVTTTYEVPMMAGVGARLAKPFIVGGMRDGTPRALHEQVLMTWGATREWKPRVGYRDPDHAYLLLLDREGRVAWSFAGPWDAATWPALEAATRAALAAPR